MGAKMLIDATHPEETRVVVVHGSRVEEFDYESASRKQLRGNIYLAKVTRVEPSLQAAFVDYGGNRHGFLAFNEIHPDYYQIPVADRQALLDEEAQEHSEAEAEDAAVDAAGRQKLEANGSSEMPLEARQDSESVSGELPPEETGDHAENLTQELADTPKAVGLVEDQGFQELSESERDDNGGGGVEALGSEDALEELPVRTRHRQRTYKIQEVIKRRQIILVQVVKEERGNKGAALTAYISLAGRFTVLMPNTARGGGISRKITNANDRKRLRKIVGELDVTGGMGLIVRTAGASRNKAEIKRDFEYLLRMWENVRDLTLHSTAPALVYEEGNLIKRSIRDLYNKDIDEILVAGDDAYREAKYFMRMLMPSHAKNVKPYQAPAPIFTAHQIERQLGAMFSPNVTLKSGGYIVINQTEALVSIDVNSGKATREHNIEDTARKTNLEAVEEISRQLRLRDLAGLLVIDFIDMEERRNNRAVERRLKDCLRGDRARIQISQISHFGLLEMSRQRLRPGVLEGTTVPCSQCQGTGIVRSTESLALDMLRTLEDTLISEGASNLISAAAADVALYILNQKRANLRDIESRYGVSITVEASKQPDGANFTIARARSAEADAPGDAIAQMASTKRVPLTGESQGESGDKQRKRRRKRSRTEHELGAGELAAEEIKAADSGDGKLQAAGEKGAKPAKPRRRGRRGGRRVRSAAAARAKEGAPQKAAPGEGNGASEAAPLAADIQDASPAEEITSADKQTSADQVAPAEAKAAVLKERATKAKSSGKTARAKTTKPKANPASKRKPETSSPLKDKAPPASGVTGKQATSVRRGWWQKGA